MILKKIGEKHLYEFADDEAAHCAIKDELTACVTSYLQEYPALGCYINTLQNRTSFDQPDVVINMAINGKDESFTVRIPR